MYYNLYISTNICMQAHSMTFMHVHAIALYAHTDYGRQYCLAHSRLIKQLLHDCRIESFSSFDEVGVVPKCAL